MEWYILLKITAPNSLFYIEVGLDYKIPFHPNLTDEIIIADYPCKINEIYYDLDSEYFCLKAEATDNLLSTRKNYSNEEIHKHMQREWFDLEGWVIANGKRIILNDYYMNPYKDFDEKNT